MKKNVGKTDMIIRVVLAIIIGAAGVYFNSWWGLLGIIPLITGVVFFCPLYALFGLRTCPARTEKQ